MAEIDKQKEKINLFKSIFLLLLGALLTLIGFIFTNFDKLSEIKLIIANISAIILAFLSRALLIIIFKEIDKLKDL